MLEMTKTRLVDFTDPPLIETALSLQFAPIEELHPGHIGLLWNMYRERYPRFNVVDEVAHIIERFGTVPERKQPPKLELVKIPPTRAQFIGTEYLVQIQKDRFIFNWRKVNEPYPRYSVVSSLLFEEFNNFKAYLELNEISAPVVNQVEFTYVNHIDAEVGTLDEIFTGMPHDGNLSDSVGLESLSLNYKHLVAHNGKNIGRLYTNIEKQYKELEEKMYYSLRFTARSNIVESDLGATMQLLRSTINNAFCRSTEPKMHKLWGMKRDA